MYVWFIQYGQGVLDRVRYQGDEMKIYLDLNLFVASYNPFDEFWSTADEKFVCKLDLVRIFVV